MSKKNKQPPPSILLKEGREKSILRGHPWVFSGGVQKVQGSPGKGETVQVLTSRGVLLGSAAYSQASQIRARMWSFDPDEEIGTDFFARKVSAAIEARVKLGIEDGGTNAYRLVFSESDGLPGVIADRYADVVVVQFLSAGAERFKEEIADALEDAAGCSAVYERSDADVRDVEGLESSTGALRGSAPEKVEITETGLKFFVDVARGHKTGFYIDQRENRALLRRYCEGKKVLNCFSYTGGFTLSALAGGAKSVVSVDSSAPALDLARENVALNSLPRDRCEWECADVFETLRAYNESNRTFDVIVLDPPKFAASAEQVEKASRAYKDINLLALKILRPGGLLFTFSCSGAVSSSDFMRVLGWAAKDSGARAAVVARMSQAGCHPVALNFPESEYLKGLVVQKR